MGDNSDFIGEVLVWAIPTIFAIILHEVMHGFVARAFGDDTAERAGRLTLNPLSHIDPIGTILLPGFLLFAHLPVFGYAKPVPVNFRALRGGRGAMVAVSAAGPLTNLTLAVISAGARSILIQNMAPGSGLAHSAEQMLTASVLINIVLAVFNLLPLLPLDGGRVLAGILPLELAQRYARLERYGFLVLFLLLWTGAVGVVINPIIDVIARMLL